VNTISTYAYLICEESEEQMWLGKAIRTPDGHVRYFHIGGPEEPLNSDRPDLTRALWKFLADHAGHRIRVAFDTDDDVDEFAAFTKIGGDKIDDIPFEQYLEGWPG
jgi:hypothetical protein